jgi:hypothetical protein
MSYIALKLARRSTFEVISFGNYVHDEMLLNAATFVAPPVSMKDFKTHLDELFTAEVATQKKTPASFTLRDQKRSVVELDLNQLADYVDGVSKGNVLIIQEAGMEPRKQPQKLTGLDDPMILQVDSASPGKLVIKCSKVDRASNYVFEHTDDFASGTWKNGTYSTTTKATIEGLTAGKEYWVRARALGTNEIKSDWSDPIAKIVS